MVGTEGLGSEAHQAKRPPQGQGRRRAQARGYSAPHVDRRNGVQLVDEEGCRVARIRRSQGSRDTAGKVVPAGTVAVVRSSDFLRASKRTTALATLVRQRRLTPSCGGARSYRGENSGPGKDDREALDTETRN